MRCGFDCEACPAAERCGKTPNFCWRGRCADCEELRRDQLLQLEVRQKVMGHLDGLELSSPERVKHPALPVLPVYLPVLVQAYADPVELPWVAIHGRRLLGVTGQSLTPKHRRPIREVYRLGPATRVALEFYVDDRTLEGVWSSRGRLLEELVELGADLVLAPNMSVWRDGARFEQLVQQRRAFLLYHEMLQQGLPAVPDVSWSVWDPDGRRWAEWINGQPGLRAVSIYCGGQRIHAEKRAHRETVEDLALFHDAVRPEVAFVLGGVHSPARLRDYRRAAPGRQLVICNGQAYALAQRRRLLDPASGSAARSARECFLRNATWCREMYAAVLGGQG